ARDVASTACCRTRGSFGGGAQLRGSCAARRRRPALAARVRGAGAPAAVELRYSPPGHDLAARGAGAFRDAALARPAALVRSAPTPPRPRGPGGSSLTRPGTV